LLDACTCIASFTSCELESSLGAAVGAIPPESLTAVKNISGFAQY
jgi:hypothetical protein